MALSLRNQPNVLTPAVRRVLLNGMMAEFARSYQVTGGTFPGADAIQAEYATAHDLEILELAGDFHPDAHIARLARARLISLRATSR